MKQNQSLELVLLLGAGASKQFDLPLFSEIEEPFIDKNVDHRKRIERMSKDLRKAGFTKDIENYISYARGQLDPLSAVLAMNPFASYYVSRAKGLVCKSTKNNIGRDLSAEMFLEDIEDFIYETYLVHELYTQDLVLKHYDKFFNFLRSKYFKHLKKDEDLQLDIFTTNYDDTLEFYSEEKGFDFFDGFNPTPDGICLFDHNLYEAHDIRIYKLHGSVRIGIVNDNKNNIKYIKSKERIPIGNIYIDNWKLNQRMMLLGHEKELSQEPYFELFRILKDKLLSAKTCIAIGYSFSNLPVLNVFKDVLRNRNTGLKLIILNLDATKIKKNKFSEFVNVQPVDGTFAEFGKI